jgi:hypothetical protein
MTLSGLLAASHKYGGPWKLLLLNLLPGALIGALLAMSSYAWLISVLHIHHRASSSSDDAIVGIATYIAIYVFAWTPATWFFFSKPWFGWASIGGDVVATAGSIAVAVLTRGSTGNCTGLLSPEDIMAVGTKNASQACKLQKVVFATGVCNS